MKRRDAIKSLLGTSAYVASAPLALPAPKVEKLTAAKIMTVNKIIDQKGIHYSFVWTYDFDAGNWKGQWVEDH